MLYSKFIFLITVRIQLFNMGIKYQSATNKRLVVRNIVCRLNVSVYDSEASSTFLIKNLIYIYII